MTKVIQTDTDPFRSNDTDRYRPMQPNRGGICRRDQGKEIIEYWNFLACGMTCHSAGQKAANYMVTSVARWRAWLERRHLQDAVRHRRCRRVVRLPGRIGSVPSVARAYNLMAEKPWIVQIGGDLKKLRSSQGLS